MRETGPLRTMPISPRRARRARGMLELRCCLFACERLNLSWPAPAADPRIGAMRFAVPVCVLSLGRGGVRGAARAGADVCSARPALRRAHGQSMEGNSGGG